MLLNHQRNLLTVVATLACVAALLTTGLTAREVRTKTAQISMAEETIRAVTSFRYLTMEVVMYGEQRAASQWERRYTSVRAALAAHHYTDPAASQLLEREKANLAVLERLFERLNTVTNAEPDLSTRQTNMIVSALFLTTQDMLDDGFDLMRLIRLDLEQAQWRATISAFISLTVLMLLIALTSIVVKRRVLKPVAELQRLTEQVTMGNLDVRLNLPMPNEIGVLGRTFDEMTGQLQQSRQAMQEKSDEAAQARQALQTFIDHTPALVMYWDNQLCNRFANQAYMEWFGQSPEQIRGKHISDVIGPERFAELAPHLASVLAGQREIFERRITLPNGELRDALFSYIPDLQDEVVHGMYGFVSDITSLKRAEAGREVALQQLQGVINAASDFAIIKTDLNGTVKLFSSGAERMLGYRAAELIGQARFDLFHLPEELREHAARLGSERGRELGGLEALFAVAAEGGSESAEWQFVRKDGSTLPVNLTVTQVRGAQGQSMGFVGIAKDIRAERNSRRVLADARDQAEQASLAKSEFLANMSHEIRTPMHAVLGMLELLQHTALSPLQSDYARKSESAARSLLGLLNDILDFSQVEANKLELENAPFRVDGLMRDLSVILASLVGTKEVELVFAIDPALPAQLRGDATRLRQVLINLGSNALKFTERGEVTVSLRLVASKEGQHEVAFTVTDSGIGIAPSKLAKIFDGFTQAEASTARRFGGTGLGLTISQRLVGLMGGVLSVESREGQGSSFTFSVCFADAGATTVLADADTACAHAPKNVLIVDDNRLSRESLTGILAGFGWDSKAVAGGAEALALLQQEDAGALPFDVLLIDWRMPDMDGWELAHRIREQTSATPIIVMITAHGRSALAERLDSERSMLNGFLTKPVTPAMLHDAICEAQTNRSIETMPASSVQSMLRLYGLRLLVVDDNAMNQQIARELLVREGATADVASGGALALEMAAITPYDAILMDIQMPDMDGYACTRALRTMPTCRDTPIIAMTANVMLSDREACLAAGMNDHMGKPIAIDTMVGTILRYCRPVERASVPVMAAAPRKAVPHSASGGAIELALALERLGGNTELYVALASTYGDEAAQFLPALEAALPEADGMAAANVLHTFKSAAAIIGATGLQMYCVECERKLRSGAAIDKAGMLAELRLQVQDSLDALQLVLADLRSETAPASGAPAQPLAVLLDELEMLLHARDMGALALLDDIESGYGDTLGKDIRPLAESMAKLDFSSAAIACARLRQNVPA